MTEVEPMIDERIITWAELQRAVGLGKQQIQREMRLRGFPKPKYEFVDGRSCAIWYKGEIWEWKQRVGAQ